LHYVLLGLRVVYALKATSTTTNPGGAPK